jgi:hypothetical protein
MCIMSLVVAFPRRALGQPTTCANKVSGTILPVRNTACAAVTACFPHHSDADTYSDSVSLSLAQCLQVAPAVASPVHPGSAEYKRSSDGLCIQTPLPICSEGVTSVSLGSTCCASSPATPYVLDTQPPVLRAWSLDMTTGEERLHLQMHFSEALSAVHRSMWILHNAEPEYVKSVGHSVLVGVRMVDFQRDAVLHAPYDAIRDENGVPMAHVLQLALVPGLPVVAAASVNTAIAVTALLGTAAPVRIVRSILHSQFLSWTGSLAVPAIPTLYRAMVQSPLPEMIAVLSFELIMCSGHHEQYF